MIWLGLKPGSMVAHRTTGGADPAGKAAQQMLAARLPGNFVLKVQVQVLQADFFAHRSLPEAGAVHAVIAPAPLTIT